MSQKPKDSPKTFRSSTAGRKIVVGVDEYVNRRTGEVEEFDVIRVQQADWNFEKLWLFRLLDLLDLAGGAKIQVIAWMLENRDRENRVIATQAKIAEGSGVSRRTVNRLLIEMTNEGFISCPQSGVYRLDPTLIWKGQHNERMNVLMCFEREAQEETKETEVENLMTESSPAAE